VCGLYFRAVAPTATNALSHDCLGCASCRQIATDSGLLVAQLGERRLESSLGQRKGGRRFCLPFGWSHHRPRLNVTLRRTTSGHFASVAENNTGNPGATLTLCSPSVYGRRRLCWCRHPSVKRHCVDLNFDVFRKSACRNCQRSEILEAKFECGQFRVSGRNQRESLASLCHVCVADHVMENFLASPWRSQNSDASRSSSVHPRANLVPPTLIVVSAWHLS